MLGYIQELDYGTYGIPDASPHHVAAASRVVDGQIGRPAGLLWSPDANGLPAWMTTKTPTRSFKIASDIGPGSSVVLTIAGITFGPGDVGSAVVLDRKATPETCMVVAASGNTLTLDSVQFAHPAGSMMEFGLTIAEEAQVVYGGMVSTSSRPLARILGISGSYRSGSRRNPYTVWVDELSPGGNVWNAFPVGQCDLDEAQGSCWLLPGPVRGGFSRVRINYVAGWSYDALPAAIKQATANIVRNALEMGDMPGNAILVKAGNATIQRASATSLDADTMSLLAPYRNYRIA